MYGCSRCTYTSTSQLREDDGASFRQEEVGTYAVEGSTITFQDSEGFDPVTATVSGDPLTFSELGVMIV